MRSSSLPSRDLVLIGAGHTNMHVARMWRMNPIPGVRLTLVSPDSRATYSGMLPGTLAGLYRPEEMEIDLYRFTAGWDIRLIVAPAVGLDPKRRLVHLADRPPVPFDVASVGIGSVPAGREVWQNNPRVLGIKPMAAFRTRLEERLHAIAPGKGGDPPRVCVVGGGAGGVEVAFCLDVWLRKRGLPARLMLLDSGEEILGGYAPGTVRRARAEFERRDIPVRTGAFAEGYADGRLLLRGGDAVEADLVIWAVGAAPPPALAGFDLPKAPDGFLAVRPTLQTTADYPVFAAGDTATLIDSPVRKAGVYAVREGPVLWENIRRIFAGRELVRYEPQRGFLSLLATGDGRAIGEYKGFSAHGRWVWRWKDYLDRKFMRMYQDYRPPDMSRARSAELGARNFRTVFPFRVPRSEFRAREMRCLGCGGKVGANVLRAALERLEIPASRFVRQGLEKPDDAALLDPAAGPVDVLTVDFFQAFLDDPYLVGRVAALNALSDIWATGAEPVGAMAMVTLPEGSADQQAELLYQLLAGGLRELRAAGATLLGGHTLEGPALAVGYTALGRLGGREPFAKANLRPGDRLVLTKPLGTGTLLAGHMRAKCRGVWMDAMLAQMLRSNAAAAEVAREFGATAVTDVTGFGLAGHLLEMLDAAGVGAAVRARSLPLLEGFRELSGEGVRSTLDPANRAAEVRIRKANSSAGAEAYDALFDPQTSGGLLIGVAADRADGLVRRLREAGYDRAAVIGEVRAAEERPGLVVEE